MHPTVLFVHRTLPHKTNENEINKNNYLMTQAHTQRDTININRVFFFILCINLKCQQKLISKLSHFDRAVADKTK